MKYIMKTNEPRSLVEHKAQAFASYDNMPADTKDELKETLLTEQGHVCCYCMKRISKTDMKIEHWRPQSLNPELSLSYKNMLGACNGNEGEPKHLQCCDTYKGDMEIFINPMSPSCETTIKYLNDGTISSDDERVNHDLNKVLNLNIQSIKNNRKNVIDAVVQYLIREFPGRQWTRANIQREINKWSNKNSEGKYKEYYGVGLFRLQKLYNKART